MFLRCERKNLCENWTIYYSKTGVSFSLKTKINHRIQKNISEPTYSVCNSELSKE